MKRKIIFLSAFLGAWVFSLCLLPSSASGAQEFIRGNANQDETLDVSDAVFILQYLFLGGDEPACVSAADVTDDGEVNLTDGIHVLMFLFLGGGAPAAPYPLCGQDSTPDDLGCVSFRGCPGDSTITVSGRTTTELEEPLAGAWVAIDSEVTFSAADGGFTLENIPREPTIRIVASLGTLVGGEEIAVGVEDGVDWIDAGNIILRAIEPVPEDCQNVVGRAAERGCGRVFVWGDEHVKFSSNLLFTEAFWHNAMDWLGERSCGPGERTRVGDYHGFHGGVASVLEARGMTVTDVASLADLEEVDIVVAQAHHSDPAFAAGLKDWVESGGALMTLVAGIGDHHWGDCENANPLISGLGLAYDCAHVAPWGPVSQFGEHPIAEGLDSRNAPFCNGRWVVDIEGFTSDVVARVGDECSPSEVVPCGTPPGFDEEPPPGGNIEVEHDCSSELNHNTDPSSGELELNIIGIYEARAGRVTVRVNRTAPMVLVLSSYSAVHWTVIPGAEAAVELVILNGYDEQFATVPPGIPVQSYNLEVDRNWLEIGYGDDCGGGDTPALIAAAEELTGLEMRSFSGCYRASEFTFVGSSPPPDPGLTVTGSTVGEGGEALPRVLVAVGPQTGFSELDGGFLLERVAMESPVVVTATRGGVVGGKEVEFDVDGGVTHVDVGEIALTRVEPEPDPTPEPCANVVGRAAERGCGRLFVWGDEHVKFDSNLLFSEPFWHNAMDWLSETTCEAGERARVGDFLGLHRSVRSVLEARGMAVTRLHSLEQLDDIDILVTQAHSWEIPGASGLKDWVEGGGALMTLVGGGGDHHWSDCYQGNELISALGLEYDCSHESPRGPVAVFGEHFIAAGLEPRNAPFWVGRWVVDVGGFTSDVVARVGDDCSPREVDAYDCRFPPGFGEEPPPGGNVPVEHDCPSGFNHNTDPLSGETELNIIGIYEAMTGRVTVHVKRTAPMVLVLSSYSAVHWTVVADPGASIDRIIANGYDEQFVTAPPGVPVETYNLEIDRNWLDTGYGNDCGGGDTLALIDAAEELTGLEMRSFSGCYRASEFTFGE